MALGGGGGGGGVGSPQLQGEIELRSLIFELKDRPAFKASCQNTSEIRQYMRALLQKGWLRHAKYTVKLHS